MNDPEVNHFDPEDARERHDYLSALNSAELYAMASEWIVLYSRAGTGELLESVDRYLTERCDLAYVAYYRQSNLCMASDHADSQQCADADRKLCHWSDLGDARELIRRPLRNMRQAKLTGRRVIDGRILR